MPSIVFHSKRAFPVIVALLVGCGFSACRKPGKDGVEDGFKIFGATPKISFPIERVISDKSGRPLEAIIVGRSAAELFVIRKNDHSEFPIAIANLSQSDRDFANGLPELPAPPGFGDSAKKKKKSEDHSYIQTREAAIARLLEKNRILESESLNSSNSMLIKNRDNQIRKNNQEIDEMQSDISRYKIDHNLK